MTAGKNAKNWSNTGGTDPTRMRKLFTTFSLYVRRKQFEYFMHLFRPKSKDSVLDIGTSPDTTLKDTNYFESVYPFKKNVTIASVEDCSNIVLQYRLNKYIQLTPGKTIPAKNKSFTFVVSWATIEHVGSFKNQRAFIKELDRIGHNVFITTPDRFSIYEPHTTLFFVHWLPKKLFRSILRFLHKDFWSKESNLNGLSFTEAKKLVRGTSLVVHRFKIASILPSHLILHTKNMHT